MSEKKMVTRSVAIGLGIVSIILAAGLVGIFAYYIPLLDDRDSTISSLNTRIADKDYQIQIKNTQINNLQTQVNNLYSALAFNESEVVFNTSALEPPYNLGSDMPANLTSGYAWGEIGLDGDPQFGLYPGMALVHVSSNYDAYVTTNFTSQGHYFISRIHVGMNGTAAFVIAPPDDSDSGIDITIDAPDIVPGATANITVTYIY